KANLANAQGATFAYKGPGTGTSPLPIYFAYLVGAGDPSVAGNYTGTNWTSTNFTNAMGTYNFNPFTPAGTSSTTGLAGDPNRVANALAAGIPLNFFRANPDMASANVTTNADSSKYDSVQFVFRRRLSDGLQVDGNYTYGMGYETSFYSLRVDRPYRRPSGSGGDVTHAFKATWVYDLPFGRGKRYGTNVNKWVDGALGGWTWSGTTRIQSGRLVDLGNVRIVGMSEKEAKNAFHLRKIDNLIAYSWPQDIIDNTIKAFNTSA